MFNKLFSSFNAILVSLTITLLITIYSGMVFSYMWEWFIVPQFDVAALTIPQAMGIMTVIGYPLLPILYNLELTKVVDEGTSQMESSIGTALGLILVMNLAWGWAWLIHYLFY